MRIVIALAALPSLIVIALAALPSLIVIALAALPSLAHVRVYIYVYFFVRN